MLSVLRLFFLLYMCRGEPIHDIGSRVSQDVVGNDGAVAQFANTFSARCSKSLLQYILFVRQSADARHFGSLDTLQDALKPSPLQIFRCTDYNPMLFFTSCDVCQPGLHCTSLTSG